MGNTINDKREGNMKRLARVFIIDGLIMLGLLLAAELFLRVAVPLTDVIWYESDAELVSRYQPNQEGILRMWYFNAHYRINNAGFNSLRDYQQQRTPGVARVAVLGDSFIAGFTMDSDKHFDRIMERELSTNDKPVEVYNFGRDGIGIGRGLLLLRRVLREYSPDTVIFHLNPEDILETSQSGNPAFLLRDGKLEVGPVSAYHPSPLRRRVAGLALMRFFRIQNQGLLKRLVAPLEVASIEDPLYELPMREDVEQAWELAGVIISTMDRECRVAGARFMLVQRPLPELVYGEQRLKRPLQVEERLKELSQREGWCWFNLRPYFALQYQSTGRRQNMPDSHYNGEGHRVLAKSLNVAITSAANDEVVK
jgi:hypothetical protein